MRASLHNSYAHSHGRLRLATVIPFIGTVVRASGASRLSTSMAMARYQTPPPKPRPNWLFPSSPPNEDEDEVVVSLVTFEGTMVGDIKVKRGVKLVDIYEKLMAALGGRHCSEPQLVSPSGEGFQGAKKQPFLNACDFDVYTLLRADLDDSEYVKDRKE